MADRARAPGASGMGGAHRAQRERLLVAAAPAGSTAGRCLARARGPAGAGRRRGRPGRAGGLGRAAPPARAAAGGHRAARLPRPGHRGHRRGPWHRARHRDRAHGPGRRRAQGLPGRQRSPGGDDQMSDQMSDLAVLDAVRSAFAGVRLTASASSITSRGRALRRRRLRMVGAAAAAASAGLAGILLAQGARPALASFTVTREPGGAVAVTIRDLNHPNALLRELRRDGVRASFGGVPLLTPRQTLNRSCLRTMTPRTRRALAIRRSADPRQAAFVIRPAAIPARDTLDIYWASYSPEGYPRGGINRASISIGSRTYQIPLSTAGPFAFQADLVTPRGRCL